MTQQCGEISVKGYRCQRMAGHEGAHMHGLDPGSNLTTAWGWSAIGGSR